MKKITFVMTILASVAAIVPANAAPRNNIANAKIFAASPGATIRVGDACWKQIDAGRGYGYWTTCDNSASFARAAGDIAGHPDTNGGGTEGGSGGGD